MNAAEIAACQTLIKLALAEDLGSAGDLTSHAAGDDHVDPVNADGGPGDTPPSPDPQYTPGTP